MAGFERKATGTAAARPRFDGWMGTVHAAVTASVWAPLVGKALLGLGAFLLLALVGSGKLRCVGVPPQKAAAAILVPPSAESASAEAQAAPPTDAGAPAFAKAQEDGAGEGDAGAAHTGVTADGKVVLNVANEEELCKLPGIGPTRAKAILALRARLVRFRRAEDLLKIKGIGRRLFARLKPLMVVE